MITRVYEVEYVAFGLWYNRYPGKVRVNAIDEDDAIFKVRKKVSKDLCVAREAIEIKSVKVV
jgi:hypothetical protein